MWWFILSKSYKSAFSHEEWRCSTCLQWIWSNYAPFARSYFGSKSWIGAYVMDKKYLWFELKTPTLLDPDWSKGRPLTHAPAFNFIINMLPCINHRSMLRLLNPASTADPYLHAYYRWSMHRLWFSWSKQPPCIKYRSKLQMPTPTSAPNSCICCQHLSPIVHVASQRSILPLTPILITTFEKDN